MAEYTSEPVNEVDALLQTAFNVLPAKSESREQSIAITKLEEAIMWNRKHFYKNVKGEVVAATK